MKNWLILVLLLGLVGCAGSPSAVTTLVKTPVTTVTPFESPTSTPTVRVIETTLTPTPTVTPSPTPIFQASSPLAGFSLADLAAIVTNSFQAPRPGWDNGHHGTDFAFYRYGTLTGMESIPVLSVLPGQVAASVHDRPPYGNMLIIETPVDGISASILSPDLQATPFIQASSTPLTCPADTFIPIANQSGFSYYLLYAHLKNPPGLLVGEQVQSGQEIGEVGNTGNSGNPHLHLEVRLGPVGMRFAGMSHYNAAASQEEMKNYCSWRVSGNFRMLDPMEFLKELINKPMSFP